MKRLYDSLSKDVMKIYTEHNLDFETKYFTLFYLISKRGSISIMDIAHELSLSHPGVIKLAKELEKKSYIESVKAPDDNRKRYLKLSKKGQKALPEFEKVWQMIYKTNKLLFAKQGQDPYAIASVTTGVAAPATITPSTHQKRKEEGKRERPCLHMCLCRLVAGLGASLGSQQSLVSSNPRPRWGVVW